MLIATHLILFLSRRNVDKDQNSQKKGSQLKMPPQDRRPKGLVKADININADNKYKGYIFFVNRDLNPCKNEPQMLGLTGLILRKLLIK